MRAINTGDVASTRAAWPALMAAVSYIENVMHLGTDGLATTPAPATGLPRSDVADNWFDIVSFGGRDAIVNAYVCAGLNGTALLAAWIGDSANAMRLTALHARCVVAYNALFWNESLSLYGDWTDTAGRTRYYGYIWQQAVASDPLSGIANASRAARMATVVEARLAEVHIQYNKSATELWCAPTNLWGVDPADSFDDGSLQDQREYGHYENGACFMALHGMYANLLGNAGRPDDAYAALEALLTQSASSGLWGQHYDWWPSQPNFNGPDVLTGALVALRHGLHAALGLRTALGAVWAAGPPAAAAEGASFTFRAGGRRVRAEVRDGATVVTYLS